MSSNNTDVLVVEDETVEDENVDSLLALPVDRQKVIRLADSLMGIHPAASQVGKLGMRTVAQLALVTGANPMPGTNGIHAWVDNKGKLCIQFGIGFWTSLIEQSGGMVWVDKPRPMTEQERKEMGVPDGDVAFICSGSLNRDMRRLANEIRQMGLDPLSYKELKAEVAHTGYGIAKPDTWANSNEYKERKSGRPLGWTAELSARRDMYRRMVSTGGSMTPASTIEKPAWEQQYLPSSKRPAPNGSPDEINDMLFATSSENEPKGQVIDVPGNDDTGYDWESAAKKSQSIDTLSMALYQSANSPLFENAGEVKRIVTYISPALVEPPIISQAFSRYCQLVADGIDDKLALVMSKFTFLTECQEQNHFLTYQGEKRSVLCRLENITEANQYRIVIEEKYYTVGPDRVNVDTQAF